VLGIGLVALVAAVLIPFRDSTSTATDALALVIPVDQQERYRAELD